MTLDVSKLEEIKNKIECDEVDNKNNKNVDIEGIRKIIKDECDVVEQRIYLGIKNLLDIQRKEIREANRIASETLVKSKTILKLLDELMIMAKMETGEVDEEELKRQQEIDKRIQELKDLGVEIDVKEVK